MGQLNNATPEQRKLFFTLLEAANKLPPYTDKEAWWEYQNTVMQPIRDAMRDAGVSA